MQHNIHTRRNIYILVLFILYFSHLFLSNNAEILPYDISIFNCSERFDENSILVDANAYVNGGSCSQSIQESIKYTHEGSDLNDASLEIFQNDEDCCSHCQKTYGCKSWSTYETEIDDITGIACILKTSIGPFESNENFNSGIVTAVATMDNNETCVQNPFIGYTDSPFNQPELLIVTSANECCLRCQEQSFLCYAWMWDSFSSECSLFGNMPKNNYICQNCSSGIRSPLPDRNENIDSIDDAKISNDMTYYTEDIGTLITPKYDSFIVNDYTECYLLCSKIRECRSWSWDSSASSLICYLLTDIPEPIAKDGYYGGTTTLKLCEDTESEIFKNVNLEGGNISEDNPEFGIPDGNDFITETAEECLGRCLEYPKCKSWTFFNNTNNNGKCYIKSDNNLFASFYEQSWSGLLEDRFTDNNSYTILYDEMKNVSDSMITVKVDAASSFTIAGTKENIDESDDNTWMYIVIPIAVFLLIVCPCLILWWTSVRRKRKEKAIKEEREKIKKEYLNKITKNDEENVDRDVDEVSLEVIKIDKNRSDEKDIESDVMMQQTEPLVASSSSKTQKSIQMDKLKERLENLKHIRKSSTILSEPGSVSKSFTREEELELEHEFEIGRIVANKYILESGTKWGQNSIVLNAKQTFGHNNNVVIKIYKNSSDYEKEIEFFNLNIPNTFIPQVYDRYDGKSNIAENLIEKPCIIMERGDYNLSEFLSKQSRILQPMDQRSLMFKLAQAICNLHEHKIAHRDIKPHNIVMFTSSLTWKLIDFNSYGKKDEKSLLQYTLRYAPPEYLAIHSGGATEVNVRLSSDVWSLGIVFWEILTGEIFFGKEYTDEDVMSMLMGVTPLPFEKNSNVWNVIHDKTAERLLRHMLQREPENRWTIQKILQNAYFSSGVDTVQQQSSTDAMTKQLKMIKKGIQDIHETVVEIKEITSENLNLNTGSLLLISINISEIDTFIFGSDLSPEIVYDAYDKNVLISNMALLEPHYNIFQENKTEEPCHLIRLKKKHLIHFTFTFGNETMMKVPIEEIYFIEIWPTDLIEDKIKVNFHLTDDKNDALKGIVFWDMTKHKDLTMMMSGYASIEVKLYLRVKGVKDVMTLTKNVKLKMHSENEAFRLVKVYKRAESWYTNLPNWAKVYIHGTISIANLAIK